MFNLLKDLRPLQTVGEEINKRPVRRRAIEVLDYEPVDPRPETHLAPEGTITVLVSRAGNPSMAEIRKALASGSADTAEIARKIASQYKKLKPVSLERAVKMLMQQPVFGEVMHGDRILLENLFAPKTLDVACYSFIYNGGKMAESGLVLVEHPETETSEGLEILALRRKPALSKAEQAALDKVPADQSTLNIAPAKITPALTPVYVTVWIVVEVAVVWFTWHVTGMKVLDVEHLDPAAIREMGPSTTARELILMRQKLLAKGSKRSRTQP